MVVMFAGALSVWIREKGRVGRRADCNNTNGICERSQGRKDISKKEA